MTTEILYCARCRRVIRPREVAEGKYHFADGEPVCAECFTRLSRRLRPVSGVYEPPKPVDLSGIVDNGSGPAVEESAAAKPKAAAPVAPVAAAAPEPAARTPAPRTPAVRTTASGPGLGARFIVVMAFALAGALAGCGVYLATHRAAGQAGSDAGKPRPQATSADKTSGQGANQSGNHASAGDGGAHSGNPTDAAR